MSEDVRRHWCCDTPIDGPHLIGCAFKPTGPIDYDGPAVVVELRPEDETKRRLYLGDGAYVETGDWAGQVCVYTGDGIIRTNQVYLEIDMIDKLHAWVHQND